MIERKFSNETHVLVRKGEYEEELHKSTWENTKVDADGSRAGYFLVNDPPPEVKELFSKKELANKLSAEVVESELSIEGNAIEEKAVKVKKVKA